MKTKVSVYLVCEAASGDRVALARTADAQAVALAASAVIAESEARLKAADRLGEPLADLQREDCRALRRSLERLIPSIGLASSQLATVQ